MIRFRPPTLKLLHAARQSPALLSRDLLWLSALALATLVLYQCGGTPRPHPGPLVKVHAGLGANAAPSAHRSPGTYTTRLTAAKTNRS